MSELDLEHIVRTLAKHRVRFVVIGAFAALAHGSPFPTEDVDVTPERSRENLARLSEALHELEARIRTHAVAEGLPFDHDADSLGAAGVWNLQTPFGDLDISFVPTGTEGFQQLDRGAIDLDIDGIVVRMASLEDIVRSKQAANRDKDRRHLPVLRELLANRDLDVN
jgi:predicted nucleotidyltransferase